MKGAILTVFDNFDKFKAVLTLFFKKNNFDSLHNILTVSKTNSTTNSIA